MDNKNRYDSLAVAQLSPDREKERRGLSSEFKVSSPIIKDSSHILEATPKDELYKDSGISNIKGEQVKLTPVMNKVIILFSQVVYSCILEDSRFKSYSEGLEHIIGKGADTRNEALRELPTIRLNVTDIAKAIFGKRIGPTTIKQVIKALEQLNSTYYKINYGEQALYTPFIYISGFTTRKTKGGEELMEQVGMKFGELFYWKIEKEYSSLPKNILELIRNIQSDLGVTILSTLFFQRGFAKQRYKEKKQSMSSKGVSGNELEKELKKARSYNESLKSILSNVTKSSKYFRNEEGRKNSMRVDKVKEDLEKVCAQMRDEVGIITEYKIEKNTSGEESVTFFFNMSWIEDQKNKVDFNSTSSLDIQYEEKK